MANGERAERRIDRQWWGKRPLADYSRSYRPRVNKFFKRLLHKIERRRGEKLKEEMWEQTRQD
ncbi:MAG TPA: hypothetical protein PKZ83_17970 [bacterium]|nr:hypothetical protein [bacterium]HQJ66533.1 hypothetical protein [bacterium]